MIEIFLKLIPVYLFFATGLLLKKLRLADDRHGELMLKFMFHITLPALIIFKVSQVDIGLEKVLLPFINIAVNLLCVSVTILLTWRRDIETSKLGVMMISTMILNNVFIFPFILYGLGDVAFSDAVIMDIGNGLMTVTLTYAVAFHYGPGKATIRKMIEKIVKLPVFWALGIAIWMSTQSVSIPVLIAPILDLVGQLTVPLILISLGIYFSPSLKDLNLLSMTIFIRMIMGLLIGISIAEILALEKLTYTVVVLCAAAPVGFNALTFSSMAKLDARFASSVVSFSVLIGMLYTPLLMYLLSSQ